MEFRAIGGSAWYDYLAVIFRSLTETSRNEEAIALASNVIDGDYATQEGYVIVGSEYAAWLIWHDQQNAAYEHFGWISKEAPTHRKAAICHYWLALRSLNEGSMVAAQKSALAIRTCFAGSPSLLSEWHLDTKAACILTNFDRIKVVDMSGVALTPKFIDEMLQQLDLELRFAH
jgi:hypothetical protein